MPGYNCMQIVAEDLDIVDKTPIKKKIWWPKREEWVNKTQGFAEVQRKGVGDDHGAQYDVIVIGAGHNGLIAATYLAKAGLKTILFERRLEAGGGLCTEEVTLPGFQHNLHSYFHDAVKIMPPMKDLELERYGMRYVCPPVQVGVPLATAKAITLHGDLESTCKSIARFSEHDAKAYRDMHNAYREFIEVVVVPALFSPAAKPSDPFRALEGTPEGMDYLHLSRKSPREVVEDVFDSDIVRAAILFQLTVPRGVVADYKGLGMLVPLMISQVEQSHVAIGGSHSLAHSLWRSYLAAKGSIRGVHEVEKIIIENGAAVGVKIRSVRADDGGSREHGRRQHDRPASDLPPPRRSRTRGRETSSQVDNVRLDEFSFFGVHLALSEAPKFTSAGFDPDMNRALKIGIGIDSVQNILDVYEKVRNHKLPDPAGCTAPCRRSTTRLRRRPECTPPSCGQHVPFRVAGESDDVWDRIGEEYADRCVEAFARYAPNLKKSILKRYVFTPLDIPRKLINMREGGVFMARTSQDQIESFAPCRK